VKLIRINVIGIHRICSDITKEHKSKWMKTFNIESEKKIKIREDKLRNAESSSDSDSESENEYDNVHIREEKIPTPSNTDNIHKDNHDMKFCMGIKCKYLGSVWHGNKNGKGKRIKTKLKNCQSCSKLRIALQKCVLISKTLTQFCEKTNENAVFLRNCAFDEMAKTKNLSTMGEILDELLTELGDGISCVRINDIHGKITDSSRLILRCLGQILGLQTKPIFECEIIEKYSIKNTQHEMINNSSFKWNALINFTSMWENLLSLKTDTTCVESTSTPLFPNKTTQPSIVFNDLISKKETPQRTRKRKLKLAEAEVHSKNQKVIRSPSFNLNTCNTKNIRLNRANTDLFHEIENPGRLLSDTWAGNLVKHFRNYNNNQVFIAGEFTSQILMSSNSCSWREIGRLFRNNNALHKGQGTYIVPSFIGSRESGHWYLNVIHWNGISGKGYTLDSMNISSCLEKDGIKKRIVDCFGGQEQCIWEDVPCVEQTELECGPRMLWYIHSITKERSPITDADSVIRGIAQLNMFNNSIYSAAIIRREVGILARNYTRSRDENNITDGSSPNIITIIK